MKNAVLNGKPYAENPHVRFGGGGVASAKPRHGSLLYNSIRLKERGLSVSARLVRTGVLVYASLPVVLFMLGWLRPLIGIPAASLTVFACWWCCRRGDEGSGTAVKEAPPDGILIRWPVFCVLCVAVLSVCVLAGQGGLVAQAEDWHWRNAVFRDLITHAWPLRFENWDGALVFYMGHWLPSALIGRCLYLAGGGLDMAWRLGRLALLLWTALGVGLVLLQLLRLLRATTAGRQLAALGLLVFFGCTAGLLRWMLWQWQLSGQSFPDWFVNVLSWGCVCQFTPHYQLLTWVFHQTVIPWMITLLLLGGCPVATLVFVVALVPLSGPFPAVGVAVFAALSLVREVVRAASSAGGLRHVVREGLSPANLVAAFVVVPLVAGYLLSNPQSGQLSFGWGEGSRRVFLMRYVVFLALECGPYFLVTMWRGLRSVWWWGCLVMLGLCPLVRVGTGPDFCMRASIPALMVLSVLVLREVLWVDARSRMRLPALALLLIGSWGGAYQMLRTVVETVSRRELERPVATDLLVTLDKDHGAPGAWGWWVVGNCCTRAPDERFFFRRFARRHTNVKDGGQRP